MNDIATDRDGLQFDELQQQLAEKEEVIAALTAQLEQAADELDRRQRSGMNRGLTVGGGGIPPELIEQQKAITEELQAAVERWEEMQAAVTLGRLEMQLTEIRELIVSQPEKRSRGSAEKQTEEKPASSRPPKKEEPKPPAAGSDNGAGWESIKSRYMVDNSSEEANESDRTAETPETIEAADDETSSPQETQHLHDTCDVPLQNWEVETPEPVDFETADVETLREAVEFRDKFIVEMTRRLRSLPVHVPPQDWEGLASVPEEMQQRLEDVLARYDEKLRCAEVELSLERARLGREEARLNDLKELLDKQQKRLAASMPSGAALPIDGYEDTDPTSKSSLWRLLGKK